VQREIQTFEDYRDFLLNSYEVSKKVHTKRSYEYYARRSGLSKSFLILLFQKKRHLSLNKITKLALAFGLSEFEVAYLALMVCVAQIKDSETKKRFEKMRQSLKFEHAMLNDSWKPRHSDTSTIAGLLPVLLEPILQARTFKNAESIYNKLTPAFKECGIEEITKVIKQNKTQSHGLTQDVVINPLNPLAFQEFVSAHQVLSQAAAKANEHQPCSFMLTPLLLNEDTQKDLFAEIKRHQNAVLALRNKTKDPTKLSLVLCSMVKAMDIE